MRKPSLLKLAFKQLLKILGVLTWCMGIILMNEKDEDLNDSIIYCKFIYAKKTKVAWDITLWEQESIKSTQFEEMQVIFNYHTSEMVHGRYMFKPFY